VSRSACASAITTCSRACYHPSLDPKPTGRPCWLAQFSDGPLPYRAQFPLGDHIIIANGVLLGGQVISRIARSLRQLLVHSVHARRHAGADARRSAIKQDLAPFTIARGEQRNLRAERHRPAPRGFHGNSAGIEAALSRVVPQREKFRAAVEEAAKNLSRSPRQTNIAGIFVAEAKRRRVCGCRAVAAGATKTNKEARNVIKSLERMARIRAGNRGQLRAVACRRRANAQTPTLAPGAIEWKPAWRAVGICGHFAPPTPPVIGPLKPGTSTAAHCPNQCLLQRRD